MENQKSIGQKIKFGVIVSGLVIIGLVSGYVLGVFGYVKVIGPYVAGIKYKRWLADYLKPYKEDFAGGNTPEETIDLFIAALKKGDMDLASRYFVPKKQEEEKEKLVNFKNQGKLQEHIDTITKAKNTWQKSDEDIYTTSGKGIQYSYKIKEEKEFVVNLPNGRGGFIEQKFPAGEYGHTIIFIININNKWKIESL